MSRRPSVYDLLVQALKGWYLAPASHSGSVDLENAVCVLGDSPLNSLGNLTTVGKEGEEGYEGKTLFAQVRRLGNGVGFLCISDLTKYTPLTPEEVFSRFPEERTRTQTPVCPPYSTSLDAEPARPTG